MARLVIVSNRVAPPSERQQKAGGLAVALKEALKGDVLWFGWSGQIAKETSTTPTITEGKRLTVATIDLGEQDYKHFYVGFSNSTLWPLFHFRLGLLDFLREDYQGYLKTNEDFAAALAPLLRPDDVIWIHDYHLIPLAAALRRHNQMQRMGFYLHIPFAPTAIMDALPCAEEIVSSLCDYDVVGFQTEADKRNFMACAVQYAGAELTSDHTLSAGKRSVRAVAIPVGIDADAFAKAAEASSGSKEAKRMQESLVGRKLIVGVDRLDYSKGLTNRFEAYSRLFDRFPQHRLKVSYLQVAARSREDVIRYQNLKRDLDRLCGKVNGKFAEFDWVPLRYMTRSLPRSLLAGFYRSAHVGLVTPLRDGMNLVAKEYIAAQNEEDPGVLILSKFAGAAESMDQAIIINPYDPDQIAEAIHQALTMPLGERQARNKALQTIVREQSAGAWCRNSLMELRAC
ncbi:trehalose-6-phosphate synthase [Dongia soli]|uniref:Trehalose-6-phosphate synthase n=1 Tax=Dongia soli TaxID=600628 RepID=A0ABU5EFF9_9PROT|nr:trehalose-6-phosphate synthase [Dongia soli]MDY0884193.1 trehalose-6-phosphate synthase [Dongia soli]